MDFIHIMAIDAHSSATQGITLSAETPEILRARLTSFEKEITYRRYELTSDDFVEDFDESILDVLDEFEVSI